MPRDRNAEGRPENARPRDALGRPLPRDATGVPPVELPAEPTPEGSLAQARALLAEGRPFQAHEVYEHMWHHAPPDDRDLWQALAQIAVALTHNARGNPRGARGLVRRARIHLLAAGETDVPDLDVPALLEWTERVPEADSPPPTLLP